MLKIGTWNIRGLNDLLKQKSEVLFVLTILVFWVLWRQKIRSANIQSVVSCCFTNCWLSMDNYSTGPVARIILGWDDLVFDVSPAFKSDQLMVVEVEVRNDKKRFLVSVVYGHKS